MRSKSSVGVVSAVLVGAVVVQGAHAQSIEWSLPLDGFWDDASNWSPADVPDTALDNAELGLMSSYHVRSVMDLVLGGLVISNPDATLTFDPPTSTSIFGSIENHGEIILASTTSPNNSLDFLFQSSITGHGTVRLAADINPTEVALNSIAQVLTIGSGQSILGSGVVEGLIENHGEIIADSLSSANMVLGGTITQSGSARIGAVDSTLILKQGATVAGGELFTTGSGEMLVLDGVVLDGVENAGTIKLFGNNRAVRVAGSMTNHGLFHVNSNDGTADAKLLIEHDVVIGGDGSIRLQESDSNFASIGIDVASDSTLTIGENQVLEGSGEVVLGSGSRLVNNGVLVGNDPDHVLRVEGDVEGGGRYESVGGQLEVHGSFPVDGQYSAENGMLRLVSVRNDEDGMISGLVLSTGAGGVIDLGG
ncbi:MAG: hypothetical protein JJ974_10050, partial [Phycisphaerales bacterium]|nr:hypothetical protein [Phycisphaerales bacterium]